jgi:hypothetical protein
MQEPDSDTYVSMKPGDWVVQNSANSGVGRSLIAIAGARGLRTINFVRRRELLKELKAAGGDIVLVDEPGAVEEALGLVERIRPVGRLRGKGEPIALVHRLLSTSARILFLQARGLSVRVGQAFVPPSTVRFAPVMYEASGPATNATNAATSSTCP